MRADFGSSLPPARSSGFTAGVPVTTGAVAALPAATAAVRFAAHQVAKLSLRVCRGAGPGRQVVEGSWQARLFRGQPNREQTWFRFWETIEESRGFRGNGFAWKIVGGDGRVAELWALHPDQVWPHWQPNRGVRYRVMFGGGFVNPYGGQDGQVDASPQDLVHFRAFGDGGALMSQSPISRHAEQLGIAIARDRWESNMYERGAGRQVAVIYPANMTQQKARQEQEQAQARMGGVGAAGGVRVFGGNPTVQTIGLSPEETELVDRARFTAEDMCRIFNVPASLVDAQSSSSRPLTPEHEMQRWLHYGLEPRLCSLEQELALDPDLFGPGARDYPRFEADGYVRGDIATESERRVREVQVGILLPDEAREQMGRDPLPDGVGQIPQIVPVGGSPAGLPLTAPGAVAEEEDE
ncbi:MAG: phage portal protein [Acidimicrobiales bacterium]